jgi:predicted aspartyl protease
MPRKKKIPFKYRYDEQIFNPPAPVIDVSLSLPITQSQLQSVNLKSLALLDSGADITVIPEQIVQELQLKYVDEITASGYDGVPKQAFIYSVKLIFNDLGGFIVRVIASNTDHVLIGRDILNKWSLLLEGRRRIFEIT